MKEGAGLETTEKPVTTVSAAGLTTEMLRDEYRVMYEVEDRHWWYRGMRRNLAALLERYHDWQANPRPRVLDAGCGTGANLEYLLNGRFGQARLAGFDLSAEALGYSLRRNLAGRLAQASITSLPFQDNSFDIALSFDVINNLPDDRPAFREIARVLRPGGLFVLNLPAYQFLYSEHDLAIRGRRRYNATMVAGRLVQAGLRVERQSYLNTLLFPPAALVRLLKARRRAARPELVTAFAGQLEAHSDLTPPPAPLNRALEAVMALEAWCLSHTGLSFPFGLSVMSLARKA